MSPLGAASRAIALDCRNVGIWIRVSTEEQARGEAPEHHLERAKMYATARGWNIVEVYDLAGQSGKAVRKLYGRWPTIPGDERRRFAESLCEKIVVGTEEIDITFSCLTTSGETTKSQQRL